MGGIDSDLLTDLDLFLGHNGNVLEVRTFVVAVSPLNEPDGCVWVVGLPDKLALVEGMELLDSRVLSKNLPQRPDFLL